MLCHKTVHYRVILSFILSFGLLYSSQGLAHAYESLAKAYKKVVQVMGSGKRLLGKYFRVAFFGQVRSVDVNNFVMKKYRES